MLLNNSKPKRLCHNIILSSSFLGKPILTPSFITDSVKAGKWLKEDLYEWCNQVSSPLDKLLLHLPKRCKKQIRQNDGKRIFSSWKVLLHVQDRIKRSAYKRFVFYIYFVLGKSFLFFLNLFSVARQ